MNDEIAFNVGEVPWVRILNAEDENYHEYHAYDGRLRVFGYISSGVTCGEWQGVFISVIGTRYNMGFHPAEASPPLPAVSAPQACEWFLSKAKGTLIQDELIEAYADNKLRWIPVSERLPEHCDFVRVTVFAGTPNADTDFGYYNKRTKKFYDANDEWISGVSAWEEKPEPWEGDDND